MGAKTVQRLRERFERDGYVEFLMQPAKVALHVAFVIAVVFGFPAFASTQGAVFRAVALVLVPCFLVVVGVVYAEQFFGAGPPLRIDRRGITFRRWREPLVLEWGEVYALFPYRDSQFPGPLVAILLSQWVWHDYQVSRPKLLGWADRFQDRNRHLVPLKVLDVSAADILAFADPETVNRLTKIAPPYRLVLDIGEDGESPLWLRGGREAPLAELPLPPDLITAVTDWNSRVVGLLEQDPSTDGLAPALEATAVEGRSLAVQLQSDLGPGAQVLFAGDVPH